MIRMNGKMGAVALMNFKTLLSINKKLIQIIKITTLAVTMEVKPLQQEVMFNKISNKHSITINHNLNNIH
jgi:hypothetical protein